MPARLPLTLLLATCLSASGYAGSVDSPADPASWAPADALVFVGVADVGVLAGQLERSAFSRALRDPAVRQAVLELNLVHRLMNEVRTRAAAALDLEPDQIRNPLAGPLALYVLSRTDDRGSLRMVLSAGVGDAALMRSYYDRATRRLRAACDRHESIAAGAATIDHFQRAIASTASAFSDADEINLGERPFDSGDGWEIGALLNELLSAWWSAGMLPESLALCLTPERLLIASRPEDIRDALAPAAPSALLDREEYQELARRLAPLGVVRVLVNVPQVAKLLAARGGPEARKTLAMLGAAGMRSLVGHLDWSGPQYESKLELLLRMDEPRQGLGRLLSRPNAAVEPPSDVASECAVYVQLALDPAEFLEDFEAMLRLADPLAADALRADLQSVRLGEPAGTLNLQSDLLAHLRGPLEFRMSVARAIRADPVQMLVRVGADNRAAIERVLHLLSEALPGVVIARELDAGEVYDVPLIGTTLAATSDAVYCGLTSSVEAALRRAASSRPLATDERFRALAGQCPPQAWCVGWVDSRRLLEMALDVAAEREALSGMALTRPGVWAALVLSEAIAGGVPAERRGDARRLADYETPQMFAISTEPDGVRLVVVKLSGSAH